MRSRSYIEALWGPADSRLTYDPETLPEARRDLLTTHPHDFDNIDHDVAGDPAIDHAPEVQRHGKIRRVLELLDRLDEEGGTE